jgi:uncharacterized protein (TIGR00266 family)
MQTIIKHGTDFASLHVTFDAPGESLRCEAGAMVARDVALDMKTNMHGTFGAALKRSLLGGESLFQNTFTATAAGQTLMLAPAVEGSIVELDLAAGQSMFLQSGAFMACTPGVELDTKWGGAKGFFSGAGLFLLKATGAGPLFFGTYGGIHAVDVGPAGYVCDTSTIVAFTGGLNYQVTKVGGLGGLFLSGEGLVCRFQGHGRLWLSTRNPRSLVSFLNPYRPIQPRNNG